MILISLGIWAAPTGASAHPLIHPLQNRTGSHAGLFLEPSGGIFSTTSNFDENSSRTPIPGASSNTRLLMDLYGSLGLTDHLFVFGRLSTQSVNVAIMNQPGISSFGLGDQLLGAAWRAVPFASGGSINLQAEATLPAYSNTTSKGSGLPYMGDGSIDLTGSAFTEVPLNSGNGLYLEAGAGFTYRSNGFSAAVPWSLLLKQDPPDRGLLYEAGFVGQISMKTDIATSDSGQRSRLDSDRLSGSGGSNLVNAMNPSWITASGRIGWRKSRETRFHASALFPFHGTNSAAGFGALLGASFDFGGGSPAREAGEPRRPLRVAPGFQTYDLDAEILSFNDQLYLVRINRGAAAGVRKGQIFDIFEQDALVAQAKVQQVKDAESILTVVEYFQEKWIQKGFSARRRVQ